MGVTVQSRNRATGSAAPTNEMVTEAVSVKAVAEVLNSSPFRTLPKPESLTLIVSPAIWCRVVEMVPGCGPSKRMEKVGEEGQAWGVVTLIV